MDNQDIEKIVKMVVDKLKLPQKEVLTSSEVAEYLGISKSYLYKLTMFKLIPHYKPMGKMCYYNKKEIEEWIMSSEHQGLPSVTDLYLLISNLKKQEQSNEQRNHKGNG